MIFFFQLIPKFDGFYFIQFKSIDQLREIVWVQKCSETKSNFICYEHKASCAFLQEESTQHLVNGLFPYK